MSTFLSSNIRLLRNITCLDNRHALLRLLIVGVEHRPQQDEGGDAAGGVGNLAGFVFGQGTAQQVGLAVAEPFIDDLVAADDALPNVGQAGGLGDTFAQDSVMRVKLRRSQTERSFDRGHQQE